MPVEIVFEELLYMDRRLQLTLQGAVNLDLMNTLQGFITNVTHYQRQTTCVITGSGLYGSIEIAYAMRDFLATVQEVTNLTCYWICRGTIHTPGLIIMSAIQDGCSFATADARFYLGEGELDQLNLTYGDLGYSLTKEDIVNFPKVKTRFCEEGERILTAEEGYLAGFFDQYVLPPDPSP